MNLNENELYHEYTLLRFLRARKFDWKKTRDMFDNYLSWKSEISIDEWIYTYKAEEVLPANI